MNGSRYEKIENQISLIIFVDSAAITKSTNKSFYGVFSMIAELPYIVRNSYKNIIVHSFCTGNVPDFNQFFSEHNSEIDFLLNNGLLVNNINFKIVINSIIADGVCIPKIFNSTQFNGSYGCLFCLHPTEYSSQFRKTIYIYKSNIQLRSNSLYNTQVSQAEAGNIRVQGLILL